jgi:hypothetical protein
MSMSTAAVEFGRVNARSRGRAIDRTPEFVHLHRARAIAHAAARELEPAVVHLEESWHLMPAVEVDPAADLAWLHLLAGDVASALDKLKVGTRGVRRVTPRATDLLVACVGLQPRLWTAALDVALHGGTLLQRIRAAVAVLRARVDVRSQTEILQRAFESPSLDFLSQRRRRESRRPRNLSRA